MSHNYFVLLFSTALLVVVTAHAEQKSPYVPEFRCDQGRYSLSLPSKLPEVMRLGDVTEEEVLSVEKWGDYTATRKRIYFSGLTLGLVAFSNDANKYMVSSAEISSQRWAHIAPFRVGESIASIRSKLGSYADNDSALNASYGSEAGDLSFEITNRKVKKIKYACYTG